MNEFFKYFFIGAFCTVIDWTIFALSLRSFNIHYEVALLLGYLLGGSIHYICNKRITFQCHSPKIGYQYTLYFLLTASSLLMSMGILAIFIAGFHIKPTLSRILTTFLMLIPNYLLHKNITFNRKLFIQP